MPDGTYTGPAVRRIGRAYNGRWNLLYDAVLVSMAKPTPYRAAAEAAKALLDVIGSTGNNPKEFWESPFVVGFFLLLPARNCRACWRTARQLREYAVSLRPDLRGKISVSMCYNAQWI